MSEDHGSVTGWLHQLKAGQRDQAADQLWRTYFHRLVRLARRHLSGRVHAVADEEDVAISAFDSFIRAAGDGRFPRLDDRDDLWQVLFVVTTRKAADLAQEQARQKRGGGNVVQVSALAGDQSAVELAAPGTEPDPAEAAALAEEVERLLARLGEPALRQIALWKLEGYTNEEIAERLGKSLATVERKLARIREAWQP